MAKRTAPLLPTTDALLRRFGDRLRLARLRRRLAAKQVAERAGMAPMTLRSLERGGAGVTIGAYLAVMQVLGIEHDLDFLGKTDAVGRDLQDARLPARALAAGEKTRKTLAAPPTAQTLQAVVQPKAPVRARKNPGTTTVEDGADAWIEKSGFASADALAGLIVPPAVPRSKKAR